jgi:ring-1,2-phenylacetyl-CoA epoxidase subunit PaaC
MAFDNVYEAITEDNDEARWAYGTGFVDPMLGVDDTVPATVDVAELAEYCRMLGDDALVMSHRLQEWCTHAPELEDEVALANIGLDLLGQARLLLSRAGSIEDTTEDALAFLRTAGEFRNVTLVEIENGDFARSMARLLVFSTWRLALLSRLVDSADPILAAVAVKGAKEVTYHRDYAARWVIRLGDGTEFSRNRMRAGLAAVWPLLGELFARHPVETAMAAAGVGVDPATVRDECQAVLNEVLAEAHLPAAEWPVAELPPGQVTGRNGEHTAALDDLLQEMQSVAREYPGATW